MYTLTFYIPQIFSSDSEISRQVLSDGHFEEYSYMKKNSVKSTKFKQWNFMDQLTGKIKRIFLNKEI